MRRGYWLDMGDRTVVMVMTQGIGANLTNDQKRAHLADIGSRRRVGWPQSLCREASPINFIYIFEIALR